MIASRMVDVGDVIGYSDFKPNLNTKLTDESILYQDDYYLAINKPSGLASQPTRQQSVSHVEAQVEALTGNADYHIVHRLDQGTSGIILLAKKGLPLAHVSEQFKEHKVKSCKIDGSIIGVDNEKMIFTSLSNSREEISKILTQFTDLELKIIELRGLRRKNLDERKIVNYSLKESSNLKVQFP